MASSTYDTSKLLIDFTQCPKGVRLVDHFPTLKTFTEFTQQQDDNIIKIAICTADQDSPFLKLRGDREIMLSAIFDFLELGRANQIGKELFQKVMDYKHEGVSECWYAYLQLQYSIDFTDWAITKETYDMLIKEANRPKEDGETMSAYANWRVKIRGQIKDIGEDLKKAEAVIFTDSKMKVQVAIEQIKKIKNYPEKYARANTGVINV